MRIRCLALGLATTFFGSAGTAEAGVTRETIAAIRQAFGKVSLEGTGTDRSSITGPCVFRVEPRIGSPSPGDRSVRIFLYLNLRTGFEVLDVVLSDDPNVDATVREDGLTTTVTFTESRLFTPHPDSPLRRERVLVVRKDREGAITGATLERVNTGRSGDVLGSNTIECAFP